MLRTTASIALVSLLSLVNGAVIDNSAVSNAIQKAAVTFDGEYYLTNVKTGKILSFTREDVTNFYTRNDQESVTLETATRNGVTGTVIEGLGKCASAQWGFQSGDAFNIAGVSYACQVGASDVGEHYSDLGTTRIAKQLWQFVPVGTTSSSSSSSDDDDSSSDDDAKYQVRAADTSNVKTKASATTSAADSQATWYDNVHMDNVVNTNRTTWICKHDAVWLSQHPDYITKGGHSECQGRLQNYLASQGGASRLVKRALPAAHLRRKRAQTVYAIVASDHLDDMVTRALGSNPTNSFGGYMSQELVNYDDSDAAQQWIVTKA